MAGDARHVRRGAAHLQWVDSRSRPNEDRKRAKAVDVLVRSMQGDLEERLEAHRKKAAPAVAWIHEREASRGLMRHVFAAWAAARGSQNVCNAHLSREEWTEWRRREKPQHRDERRLREAVDRATSFARCCFNKFWADREKKRRTLAIKLAVLRKARVASNWSRARDFVACVVWRTRTGRDKARWPKRIAAVMADVVERMRHDAAAQLRAQRGRTLPARRARVNLLHATVVGPVLTDMYIAARPLGDG